MMLTWHCEHVQGPSQIPRYLVPEFDVRYLTEYAYAFGNLGMPVMVMTTPFLLHFVSIKRRRYVKAAQYSMLGQCVVSRNLVSKQELRCVCLVLVHIRRIVQVCRNACYPIGYQ